MPNDAEQNELLELLGTLLGWLRGIQLKDRDFIRGSLIDGLERFEFRLRHIHWFGWDYAAASLREVIAAYLVLEKVTPTLSNPDAEAVLMKIGGFFKRMDGIVSGAKDIHEKADWVLQVSTWAFRGLVGTGGAALAGLLN
ncbi:hypothetical protein NX02_05435 [Sphingomonas sanxanigenens DSM 19645 = NX02]|uniref:Uncharacterized protein n=2 Tax=Sphingomonas sanxanigenens TaxID=397260 RepID=W0A6W0_9SPHN|nr:hypothetical protein NX02_05435 [Sphingomonas sanxanigenens DSM 19645 = NX02]